MTAVADEMITAWLDDELSPSERKEFEAAVAASPELGMRVARLSRLERMLVPAFAETFNASTPDRFDAMLRRRTPAFSMGRLRAILADMFTIRQAGMVAASLVVGVVVGGTLLASGARAPGVSASADGRFAANAEMSGRLASVAAGEGGEAFNIRVSLIDDAGRYCRQFETVAATGLACREGDSWIIDTLSATGHAADDGAYTMADGAADPAIAAALERRGVREVLDAEAEAAAIKAGWNKPAK